MRDTGCSVNGSQPTHNPYPVSRIPHLVSRIPHPAIPPSDKTLRPQTSGAYSGPILPTQPIHMASQETAVTPKELDAGMMIRRALFLLLLIGVTYKYLGIDFKGLSHPKGMDQAQIARQIAD